MTTDEILKRKEMYLEAEKAILLGAQSYDIGGQKLTRASLADIRKAIAELDIQLSVNGNRRFKRLVPVDD
ncbi:MAG: primosomal replication protein PriB/PriC domain protein [Candidatus Cloacimonetes bacterium]|nr:primosomal replication protein PriB/PriC domain protein [Candidatus Cloacimonadota bacterium]